LPRKTDANNPADWLSFAQSDLEFVRLAAREGISFRGCRSKLAEVLEKVLKAELIRLGWSLEKTYDLNRLIDELIRFQSDFAAQATPAAQALAEVYFTDRYPGFDLDDADWPTLRQQVEEVSALLDIVKSRLPT